MESSKGIQEKKVLRVRSMPGPYEGKEVAYGNQHQKIGGQSVENQEIE